LVQSDGDPAAVPQKAAEIVSDQYTDALAAPTKVERKVAAGAAQPDTGPGFLAHQVNQFM
jgi:hypothetical protein